MTSFDFHCQIDEDMFSLAIFLTRLISGAVLLYVAAGSLLYYRDFLYNAAALGWPMPVAVGITLSVSLLFLGFLLILGWFTRLAAGLSVLVTAAAGVLFFAGNFNKIYVALLALLIAALLPATLLGPGKISLDYNHALRRAKKEFRG
jgi:uncharacterized membrane protein YphA (DoxX/SURF4 family)